MKKISMKHEMRCLMLLLFASVLAVSCNDSNAGTATKTAPAAQPTQQNSGEGEGNNMGKGMGMNHSNNAERDYVMMHDGKVMMMKGGKSTPMTSDMTMGNGTMVMKNGTMMMKDGTNKRLQEGEVVYMDGSMGRVDMKDHKHQ